MSDNFWLNFVKSKKNLRVEKEHVAGLSSEMSDLHLASYFEGAIKTISRRHFKLFYDKGQLFIEDLESSNGTEVNGQFLQPFKPERLYHEDTIRIAKNDDFVIEVISENSGTDVIDNGTTQPPPPPQYGIYFNEDENTFYVDGQVIHHLSQIRYDLLKYLYDHQRRERSHYQIIKKVWHGNGNPNTVAVAIGKLRKQLEKASSGAGKERYIKTIHGYGYKLITE